MKIEEYYVNVKNVMSGLSVFLTSKNMSGISQIADNPYDLVKSDISLAVYFPVSISEINENGGREVYASIVLDFFYGGNSDTESIRQSQIYFSEITDYIHKNYGNFSASDSLSEAHLYRMDLGDDFNGCSFLLESKIQSVSDYDYR